MLSSVDFSPDGREILSGSKDNTIRRWDLSLGRCLCSFEVQTHVVNSVAFSPDGRHALSGSDDGTIKLWDLAIGECLHTFGGYIGEVVFSVAFNPNG